MKMLTVFKKTIYIILITTLLVLAGATVFSLIETPGGYRVFVVQSGSMEPAIKTGSVVLVAKQKTYKKGEAITYLTDPKASLKNAKSILTHRIVQVNNEMEEVSYVTKGDANKSQDRETVPEKQVLGKVFLSMPYVGHAVAFSKSQTGFIVLIVIPATLIIYSEFVSIKKRISQLWIKQRNKKEKIEKKVLKPEQKKKKRAAKEKK